MQKLLPDALKDLWQAVEQKQLTFEAFNLKQERLLGQYRRTWEQALCLDGHDGLSDSLLAELGSYTGCSDRSELQRRCLGAVLALKSQWQAEVDPTDRRTIERFYDVSQATLYELMWWHSLKDELSPLAYVTAWHFASQHGCQRYLDFGAGVGSGAILFARHGARVHLADISSTLLDFSRWRLDSRRLEASYIDLKDCELPHNAFDFITAMDVFEHLVDPVATVEQLWDSLVPGGFLYARINTEPDEERPQHIVRDFGPTFDRLFALGFVQTWQDDWLWGHKVFEKV
jgi:2-polyprenyl-3-methyl-5-hydroxy-6-metoxy-1,4-benzoquinol methylase